MKIADRKISIAEPPYIIAEISGNHLGSLDNAIKLIRYAKRAGANAVKTQCYEADSLTLNVNKTDFIIQNGLWRGQTLHQLYSKTQTPMAWQKELYSAARDENITIFSSVFDNAAVDLLERLGAPAYKIASFEIVDIPLIQHVASTGKPIIISTGGASDGEITAANDASNWKAAFLHCTSEYPAKVENANLGRMSDIAMLLGLKNEVGISDHTLGDYVPVMATAIGASIIEKHLKLPTGESEDSSFSLTPNEFTAMCARVRQAYAAVRYKSEPTIPKQFRRSLYAVMDIAEGDKFTKLNVRSIRPGYGAPPEYLSRILGKPAKRAYRRGDPIQL